MSIAAVQDFLTKVSEDQALQEQIAKAMESDNDRQAVTDLARSKGFDFTAAELGQEIQNREAAARQQAEAGELSEDELESVAGGTGTLMLSAMKSIAFPSIGGSILKPTGTMKW
jgi:predicted ribosomally synthesized peptide with nif11-like leader